MLACSWKGAGTLGTLQLRTPTRLLRVASGQALQRTWTKFYDQELLTHARTHTTHKLMFPAAAPPWPSSSYGHPFCLHTFSFPFLFFCYFFLNRKSVRCLHHHSPLYLGQYGLDVTNPTGALSWEPHGQTKKDVARLHYASAFFLPNLAHTELDARAPACRFLCSQPPPCPPQRSPRTDQDGLPPVRRTCTRTHTALYFTAPKFF